MLCAAAMATKPRPAAKPRTPSTRRNPTASQPDPTRADGAPTFAEIGREAAREAQRKALLRTLKAHDWNLAHTAAALGMGTASAVIRALKALAPEEYESARTDGRVRAGRRWDT